ncbi:MAG: diaminopimelate decarboxylase, partial [Candidatus Blochmannia sp. A2]|nr:diaminopimelate decarboxylase [Candidatus Blochmannia sp. A2]
LVTQVQTVKKTGSNNFVLINAGFNDLVRPTMYGSYHHISVIPGDDRYINPNNCIKTIIGGPLCESGDIFTQTSKGDINYRQLPIIKIGDYLVFHDTGAYGSSMSSNYNTQPLIQEILFENNSFRTIRRRQKIQEIFMLEQ